jgi:hypothetical protein
VPPGSGRDGEKTGKKKIFYGKGHNTQGVTQKFLNNCYKTQITSYMNIIYVYS